MRYFIGLTLAVSVASTSPMLGQEAQLAKITIGPGFSAMYRAPRAFSKIVQGDESALEVRATTDRDVVLTAKKVGISNVLFLDANSQTIADLTVSVGSATSGLVYIHNKLGNAAGYTAYQCSPLCIRIEDKLEGVDRVPPPRNIINIAPTVNVVPGQP